jgi:hypothetical protein
MTSLPPGQYTLTGPNNEVIFKGGLNDAMQIWPGTQAQREAAEAMYKMEKHKQDAEQRLADVEAKCAEAEAQRDEALAIRDEAIANARELVKDAQQVADSIGGTAKAHEEEQETERVAAIAEELAPIIPPEGEQTIATPDDGELEIKHEVDPERYGPGEREDATPEVKAALSYGTGVPLSYVPKRKDEGQEGSDPIPFDPASPGEVDIPAPGPDPGSVLYPPHPQVAQPTAISLNEE